MSDSLPAREAYEAWAARYDSDANPTRDLDAQLLRASALPLAGATVVEFGAGTGKNTRWLAAQAAQVTALDLSAAMLDLARARVRAAHVRFVEHDIQRPWPVPAAAADIVVGNLVLEHVEHLGPVFAQARRALRAGGLLYVCELHPFRQLRGSVARFERDGREQRIEAWLHLASDYVNAAAAEGFALQSMAEPADVDADPAAHADGAAALRPGAAPLPRLLQFTWRALGAPAPAAQS